MVNTKKHSHHALTLAVLLLILFMLVVAIAYVLLSHLPGAATQPKSVIVSGAVKTIGFTTSPTDMYFTTYDGRYHTTVAYNEYAISLLNNHIYNVTVYWKSVGGIIAGSCSAGSINLFINSTTVTYNATC